MNYGTECDPPNYRRPRSVAVVEPDLSSSPTELLLLDPALRCLSAHSRSGDTHEQDLPVA